MPTAPGPRTGPTQPRVPLHWLTTGERRPACLRSDGNAEDAVYKGPLCRHVVHGHGAHLSLGQHRHRLHPGQGAPSRPEARKAEHGPRSTLHTPVVLLDPVVAPAATPVLGEAPQLPVLLHLP